METIQLSKTAVHVTLHNAGTWELACSRRVIADGVEEVTISIHSPKEAVYPVIEADFQIPKQDICCRWHASSGFNKNIVPEWGAGFSSELASSAPVMALVGQSGLNRLTCACSDALRKTVFTCGIQEVTFLVNTHIRFLTCPEPMADAYTVTLRFDFREQDYEDTLRGAFAWYEENPAYRPAEVPEGAFAPFYSSWYSYHKDFVEDQLVAECREAAKLGMRYIIMDDGWQSNEESFGYSSCGDWEPARKRFASMKTFVEHIHQTGMKLLIWYSLPFMGTKTQNYQRFQGKYLYHSERLNASVLDPRFPEVRQYLIDLYRDAMQEWNLDGFKLDFIDSFVLPANTPDPALADNYAGRDFKSVPAAVDALLTDIMASLKSLKPDILIEFRQSYIGPAIRKYGNLLRAGDCPGDLTANRVRCADLRLSSGPTAVHGDMLRWHQDETTASAAMQLIAVLFAVPQISVRLDSLNPEHKAMLAHRLDFYQKHWKTLTQGRLSIPHPEMTAPLLRSEGNKEAISACYLENLLVPCPKLADGCTEIVVNGSTADSLLLQLPCKATATITDACGHTTVQMNLEAGIQQLPVPSAGEVLLELV